MQARDSNAHLMPFSSFLGTAHIVREGGVLIYYQKAKDGIFVENIDFYKNKKLLELEDDDTVLYQIPYILDIDKQ